MPNNFGQTEGYHSERRRNNGFVWSHTALHLYLTHGMSKKVSRRRHLSNPLEIKIAGELMVLSQCMYYKFGANVCRQIKSAHLRDNRFPDFWQRQKCKSTKILDCQTDCWGLVREYQTVRDRKVTNNSKHSQRYQIRHGNKNGSKTSILYILGRRIGNGRLEVSAYRKEHTNQIKSIHTNYSKCHKSFSLRFVLKKLEHVAAQWNLKRRGKEYFFQVFQRNRHPRT